nr:SDR family NAD(P)-dependent oxidoreductase [Parvularcula dongshanensis]
MPQGGCVVSGRFAEGARAAVFGASGGIGEAFVRALVQDDSVAEVHAFSRRPIPSVGKVTGLVCDPLNEDDLAGAAGGLRAGGPLDLVICAVGTLHGDGYAPEKAFGQLTPGAFEEVMRINALAPALVAKHTWPLLTEKRPSRLALLSARVGSIADNRLGGWHSYRASKAALNMLIRGLSIEVARKNENAVVVGLHPGTVDTPLSQPFQRGVPEGKLFTPDYAAGAMLDVLAALGPEASGGVFDYAGESVPA